MRAAVVVAISACTSLGPIPTTTGVSAVQAQRPTVEAQTGAVPGFFLSQSAQDIAKGRHTSELGVNVEPDRWLSLPGLIAGARVVGEKGDSTVEPWLGFRHAVHDDVSLAAVVFGTEQHADTSGATYRASRIGGEAAVDVRAFHGKWLAAHVQGGVSVTRLDATGRYCANNGDGKGTDCSQDGPNTPVDGELHATTTAATGSLALDIAPSATRWFAGARLAILAAAGEMPLLVGGAKDGSGRFYSGGFTITLGFGG